MNLIDIVLLIPIAWGLYKGFSKGLVQEIAQVAALVVGVLAGLYLSKWIGSFIAGIFNINEEHTQLIAFVIAFIGALINVFFVAKIIEKVVRDVSLGIVNRIAGAAFACIKYVLILSIIINFINSADKQGTFISKDIREKSLLYAPIGKAAPFVMPFIMQILSDVEENSLETTSPE